MASKHQSQADHFLFTRHTSSSFFALLVYVDDIVIASNNSTAIDRLTTHLNTIFKLKDLKNLKYFMGIEVAAPNGVSHYVNANTHWTSFKL